jgi:hypothetical protein
MRTDDRGAAWDAPARAEFAAARRVAWSEIAGVAHTPDDGFAPEGLTVFVRGERSADFLPLAADGARALLDEARRRGLIRPIAELQQAMSGVSVRADRPRGA